MKYCQRTVNWLRNNSKCMVQSLGEHNAMRQAEFYPLKYNDLQIWNRWKGDNASGLVKYYFKK